MEDCNDKRKTYDMNNNMEKHKSGKLAQVPDGKEIIILYKYDVLLSGYSTSCIQASFKIWNLIFLK